MNFVRNVVRPLWSVAMYPSLTERAASNGEGSSFLVVGVLALKLKWLAIGVPKATRQLLSLEGERTSDIGSKDMCENDNLCWLKYGFLTVALTKLLIQRADHYPK